MGAENRDAQKTGVDSWLDSALKARIDAEPRMGLEDRVLARLAAEPERKAFAWWWPALGGAAAILAILLGLAASHPSSRKPTLLAGSQPSSPEQVDSRDVQAKGTLRAQQAPVRARSRLRIAHSTPDEGVRRSVRAPRSGLGMFATNPQQESLPRLATFPASRPKTQQERLLAQLAAWNESHQDVKRSPDIASLKELSVKELEIDPLESSLADETPKR